MAEEIACRKEKEIDRERNGGCSNKKRASYLQRKWVGQEILD